VSQIFRRPLADCDLIDAYRYYAWNASLQVADRFIGQVEATLTRLVQMPGMGVPYQPCEPLFDSFRYVSVGRFRSYLIFYRPIPNGIEVFRVLHGARDLDGILAGELGIEADEELDG